MNGGEVYSFIRFRYASVISRHCSGLVPSRHQLHNQNSSGTILLHDLHPHHGFCPGAGTRIVSRHPLHPGTGLVPVMLQT